MDIDLAALPDDIDTLHRMISELVSARDHERSEAQAEIDRLRSIVKTLQRHQFGRRSERLDNDQLQLGLEDLDADIAGVEAALPKAANKLAGSSPCNASAILYACQPPLRPQRRPSLHGGAEGGELGGFFVAHS